MGKMKTKSLLSIGRLRGRSRSLTQSASLVAITSVVAAALVCVQPVFADAEIDGSSAAGISTDRQESPAVPDWGKPWDVGPSSFTDPALAPAPTGPMDREQAPMLGGFAPESSGGPWMERPEGPFAQPWVNPAMPDTQMRELPPVGTPFGGFNGRVR